MSWKLKETAYNDHISYHNSIKISIFLEKKGKDDDIFAGPFPFTYFPSVSINSIF